MKQVKMEDLRPGRFYWKRTGNGKFLNPVRMLVSENERGEKILQHQTMRGGNKSESYPTDIFYELREPNVEAVRLFSKSYDGESIVDMDRDISECLDADFNPLVNDIPEMEESPGFWAGTFKVTVEWVPDSE